MPTLSSSLRLSLRPFYKIIFRALFMRFACPSRVRTIAQIMKTIFWWTERLQDVIKKALNRLENVIRHRASILEAQLNSEINKFHFQVKIKWNKNSKNTPIWSKRNMSNAVGYTGIFSWDQVRGPSNCSESLWQRVLARHPRLKTKKSKIVIKLMSRTNLFWRMIFKTQHYFQNLRI